MVPDQRPRGGTYMGSMENMEVEHLWNVWKKVDGVGNGEDVYGTYGRCM